MHVLHARRRRVKYLDERMTWWCGRKGPKGNPPSTPAPKAAAALLLFQGGTLPQLTPWHKTRHHCGGGQGCTASRRLSPLPLPGVAYGGRCCSRHSAGWS